MPQNGAGNTANVQPVVATAATVVGLRGWLLNGLHVPQPSSVSLRRQIQGVDDMSYIIHSVLFRSRLCPFYLQKVALLSIFTEDGQMNSQIENRIQKANNVSYQLVPH